VAYTRRGFGVFNNAYILARYYSKAYEVISVFLFYRFFRCIGLMVCVIYTVKCAIFASDVQDTIFKIRDSIISCIFKILFWSILFFARYCLKILSYCTMKPHLVRLSPLNQIANTKLIKLIGSNSSKDTSNLSFNNLS